MHKQLRTNIVTALGGVSGITGGIWFGRTKETPSLPYAVIHQITNGTYIDTVDSFEEYLLQISVWDKAVDPSAIETIANDIYDALDGATFSLNDYYLLICKGQRRPRLLPEDDYYWHCFIEFKINLQKK